MSDDRNDFPSWLNYIISYFLFKNFLMVMRNIYANISLFGVVTHCLAGRGIWVAVSRSLKTFQCNLRRH